VVVDASVAVKWFIPEEGSGRAQAVLESDRELLAPDLLWREVANVLWRNYRRQELDARAARRILRDLARVPIDFHPAAGLAEAALETAITHGITAHDGLYLALAMGQGCPLVTADRRLHEACRRSALASLVTLVDDLR